MTDRILTVWIEGLSREVTVVVKADVPASRRVKQALHSVWNGLTDDERNAVADLEVIDDEPLAA